MAAAFIGPGTVTVCSMLGQEAGYALLWALLFSLIATYILQEMCARLGLITQKGLGEAIQSGITSAWLRYLSILLVILAIVVGNAAYQAGNISGAYLGLQQMLPSAYSETNYRIIPLAIGIIAFALMALGGTKFVTRFLIVLVILMSLVFLLTAVMIQPPILSILKGLFVPRIPDGQLLLALAVIGTTVVPYNLFLHASTVSQKWKKEEDLPGLRMETLVAIGLGGLVSMSIVITSAASQSIVGGKLENIADMALQLEPLLGSWAKYFLAMGLFSAGLSSALTAPLAAAYAMQGIFNGSKKWFTATWVVVLTTGTLFASLGYKPLEIIKLAQVSNALLLPLMVFLLIRLMNNTKLLGKHVNSFWQNVAGWAVLLVCLLLTAKLIF